MIDQYIHKEKNELIPQGNRKSDKILLCQFLLNLK